jgi:hypothetical protein
MVIALVMVIVVEVEVEVVGEILKRTTRICNLIVPNPRCNKRAYCHVLPQAATQTTRSVSTK